MSGEFGNFLVCLECHHAMPLVNGAGDSSVWPEIADFLEVHTEHTLRMVAHDVPYCSWMWDPGLDEWRKKRRLMFKYIKDGCGKRVFPQEGS